MTQSIQTKAMMKIKITVKKVQRVIFGTNNSTQKNNSYNSNNSDKSNASNKSDSSNSTNNNSGGSVSKPSHEHVYNIPVTQKIHHDAVTKTETVTVVDQQAYDEPIYESHQICKVCGKDFGKGGKCYS